MRKLQSSIEKFMLLAIVTVVAIGVLYFLYSSFYSTVSHVSIKSYMVQANFDNIYGNKTSIFILLKNKTNIGSNTLIKEKITFSNGTSNTISVPFELQMSSASGGGYLYYFTTSNFPAIANSSQAIKISNIYAISGNTIIESENNSVSYTAYYYTKASLANLPLYYLNMTASPLNAGALTPGSGYYYAGSKVAIGEKPNTGYAFNSWDGSGNENYTGDNKTAIITMNSNVSEYANFVKLVKMYVNATYNGIPVYVNGLLNITTNGTIYFMPGAKYTLFIPRYIAFSNGTRYVFENMQDDCGISIAPNSNSTTVIPSYANYNCKFTINVVKIIRIYLNATYTGIPVYANGELIATTNEVVYLMPGTQETLSFPNYVPASNGVRYAFENMQDNCSIPIIQNSNSTTFIPSSAEYNCKFTANYVEQYYLTMLSSNTTRGTVSPSSGWYNKGSSVEISATPLSSYIFSAWQGSGAGSYSGINNQTNIILNGPISEEAYFTIATVYNPTSYKGYANVVFNENTNLKGDIIAHSVTIDSGVTLSTNGYSIICSDNFINDGTINTGYSGTAGGAGETGSNGSGGVAGGNGVSITTSYGGSGGGGGGANYYEANGGSGGSTTASGGSGGNDYGGAGENGASSSAPTLSSSTIATWYSNGIQEYLEGAGGGGGGEYGGAESGGGGTGGGGIYIQATNITAGTINTNGQSGGEGYPGAGNTGAGGGGGGGGGTILLAYANTYKAGTYNTAGGSGGSKSGSAANGGNGGSGLVLTYQYTTPPISPT